MHQVGLCICTLQSHHCRTNFVHLVCRWRSEVISFAQCFNHVNERGLAPLDCWEERASQRCLLGLARVECGLRTFSVFLEHQWMSAGSLAAPFIPVLCSYTEITRTSSPLCPAPSTSCAFLYSVMVQLHTAPGHCQLLYSSNAATARVQRSRSSGGMLFPCSALLCWITLSRWWSRFFGGGSYSHEISCLGDSPSLDEAEFNHVLDL